MIEKWRVKEQGKCVLPLGEEKADETTSLQEWKRMQQQQQAHDFSLRIPHKFLIEMPSTLLSLSCL